MVDEMDWKAAMDSEVFRGYVTAQLQKEAQEEANRPTREQVMNAQIDEMDTALTEMDNFEEELRKSPEMLAKFKQAKAFLMNNPDAHDKVSPDFIKGIMMLDLGELDV